MDRLLGHRGGEFVDYGNGEWVVQSAGGEEIAWLGCLSFAFGASCVAWQKATERKTLE